MVLQVVSEAIENTDVNIGLDNNGQLQVAVLPKDQENVSWVCGKTLKTWHLRKQGKAI